MRNTAILLVSDTCRRRNASLIFTFSVVVTLGFLVIQYGHKIDGDQIRKAVIKQMMSTRYSPCNATDEENDAYLIPADDKLKGLNDDEALEIYWKYINTLQVLCRNQSRVGSLSEGGKEVCLDNKYKPKTPCLVYSFGSNSQFDFEEDVIRSYGCEVHTFDPSNTLTVKVPKKIHFHVTGLSDSDYTNSKNWKMKSLTTIMKELQHSNTTIDILKIDIEGEEWKALPEMFLSGVLSRVKQICLELHYGPPYTVIVPSADRKHPDVVRYDKQLMRYSDVASTEQLKVLRILHELGFKIFMRERNVSIYTARPHPKSGHVHVCQEISLINTKWIEREV